MKGDVTINCSSSSVISIYGGDNGAGIGGGRNGNQDGKVRINGGNVRVFGGDFGAGIGGGKRSGAGGGAGDVYIGGGSVTVYAGFGGHYDKDSHTEWDSNAQAIGGGDGRSESHGKVYIAADNNGTGRYMQLRYYRYAGDDGFRDVTAPADKRSSKCHQDMCHLFISVCDHRDHEGNSGLTCVIGTDRHTIQCKYCGWTMEEDHVFDENSTTCALCGYAAGSSYVLFDSNGGSDVAVQLIENGSTATRPEDPSRDNWTFDDWYLVTDGTMAQQPYDFSTPINGTITLKARWLHVHDDIAFVPWESGDSLPAAAGSYCLTRDVTLGTTSGGWAWNSGTLNLCLNGYKITGSLYSNGHALITVNGGTLNLFDEEGGGIALNSRSGGDAVIQLSGGSLTMNGGSVSGSDIRSIRGVQIGSGGSFAMNGGALTGSMYGVYTENGGSFTVSGDVRITGSKAAVYLASGTVIRIGSTLSPNGPICVEMQTPGVFTDGLSGKGTEKDFASCNSGCMPVLNADGEAYLTTAYTVAFDFNDGSTVDFQAVLPGETVAEPEDPVRGPLEFIGWYQVLDANTGELAETTFDFSTPITMNITLMAKWLHVHEGVVFEKWTDSTSLPTQPGNYFLSQDVTLRNGWVWSSGTINLCLNGHKITGGASGSTYRDYFILVNGGTLNLYDEGSGTITHDRNSYAPVVKVSSGTFAMYGGCVTDNNQTMNGCVRVSGSGVFAISGSARIKGGEDAYAGLENGSPIQILDALGASWRMTILINEPGVFTSDLSGKGTAANFASWSSNYTVGLNADGEAVLGKRVTVIFAPGDDSAAGTMDNATVVSGSAYTLPGCGYTVSGKVFAGWQIGEETKQPGDTVTVTANTTVTALWELPPVFGNADFILPAGTASIEANAFEGVAATVVEIPANCTSIGDYAFRDCTGLTMIRIPAGCALGTDVFDGCTKVYIFGTAGSPAETYCGTHGNCVFVGE